MVALPTGGEASQQALPNQDHMTGLKPKKPCRNGFTLIELALYISLMSIMMIALVRFLPLLTESRIKSQTIHEVEQQGFQAMQIVLAEVRNAESILAPSPGSAGDALELSMSSTSAQVRFDLAGDVLEMVEAGQGTALTNNRVSVSGLTVQNASASGTPGIVHIQFTITHHNPGANQLYDYHETFDGGAALRFSSLSI
jgi:type II secretory pathway pseudopilin PulG